MNINYFKNKTIQLLSSSLLVLFVLMSTVTTLLAQNDNNDVWTERWTSCAKQPSPNPTQAGLSHWINYEFHQATSISTSHFWNANVSGESEMGAKEVTIDYSLDGFSWQTLGNYTFPKAPESSDYSGFAGPDFGSLLIKKILITINNTYGNGNCASLGEVRFDINNANPCASQGGDSDGDGVCNNIDNCPNISNANQTDSNNNGVGDACENGNLCENLNVTCANNQITVSGLNASPIAQLQVFNASWQSLYSCSGDCNGTETINVNEGTHHVVAKLYTANWQAICEQNETLQCSNTNPCENQGGDSDGDGVCNDIDNCINISNTDQLDANNNGIGDACESGDLCDEVNIICANNQITVNGLNSSPIAQLQVYNASWQTLFSCSGDCNETEIVAVSDGTHHVIARLYTASWQSICERNETLECTGNSCVSQGGDSDGDGVCNDNDNCPNISNPDQIDANNNGVGDACESDNPCDEISIECTNNLISVSGLDASPIAQLQVFNASWQSVYSCLGDCNGTETIAVNEGTHYVIAKLYTGSWSPICEQSETLECSDTNPCENQGGDSDGDGVCNNIDNCPNTPNANQSDANNNGIGDACESGDLCDNISIVCTNSQITVDGLNSSPIAQLQVYNASWQTLFSCSGDCNETETIAVSNGTHHVIARLYTATWQSICEKNETLNCSGIDPCENQGGDSDSDGICNNNDNCPNISNPGQSDGNGNGIGDACESADPCDNISINCTNGSLFVSGLDQPGISSLQVFNASWQTVFSCVDNCQASETIVLGNGEHHVIAKYFNTNWQLECQIQEDVNCSTNALGAEEDEVFFFQAQKERREVGLQWIVNTDYKTAYFEIERSIDGSNFDWIGEVLSLGDLRTYVNYRSTDNPNNKGTKYYRIKQVFQDGSSRYSRVREVNFDLNIHQFSVYPNPATEEVFVNLNSFAGKEGDVQIADVLGRVVYRQHFSAIPDLPIRITTSEMASGVFAVSVKVEGEKLRTALLVVAR